MKKFILTTLVAALSSFAMAADNAPAAVNTLDHVFAIVMENHGYGQIINNPNAPFINAEATSANLATNYFAIGHPSLTNYLEMVGASNFGVQSDNSPDWHNASSITNLSTGVPNTDNPPSPAAPTHAPDGRLSPEQVHQMLREIAENSQDLPKLPTSAFSRESFYEGR